MGEQEKDILKAIAEALPEMSEFDKGYVLGMAESRAKEKQTKEELK